jgi:hypothetical protein
MKGGREKTMELKTGDRVVYVGPSPDRGEKLKKKLQKQVLERLNAHAKRSFELIHKSKLKIPVELYQRDEADGKVAREITLHWDWVAFGCLIVIQRENGELHIADGGTRWNAAMAREDINNLPCLLFKGLSDEEACDTFLRINLNRRKLSTVQQQHGELFSGHDLAVRTDAAETLFREHSVSFDSLSALRTALRSAPHSAEIVINLAPQFARERHISSRVFKALVKLQTMLERGGDTLGTKLSTAKLIAGFAGLDRMLCAIIPQAVGRNRVNENAQIIARALKIRIPKIASKSK